MDSFKTFVFKCKKNYSLILSNIFWKNIVNMDIFFIYNFSDVLETF